MIDRSIHLAHDLHEVQEIAHVHRQIDEMECWLEYVKLTTEKKKIEISYGFMQIYYWNIAIITKLQELFNSTVILIFITSKSLSVSLSVCLSVCLSLSLSLSLSLAFACFFLCCFVLPLDHRKNCVTMEEKKAIISVLVH